MELALLSAGLIALICIGFSKISKKLGVPILLVFLLLGMLFGTNGVLGFQLSNFELTEKLCIVGLIFIMFYGGFGTSLQSVKPHLTQAILLSSLGTIITAATVAISAHLILNIKLSESIVLGAVLSSTDAASVFNILRSKRLNLKGGLAQVLEVESGSNDPFAYLLTFIGIMLLSARLSAASTLFTTVLQLSLGLACGLIIGLSACKLMQRISFGDDGSDTIVILALALLSYALPQLLGGNGFLSVYIAGIIIGNSTIGHKIELVHFFDGLTNLSQMVIFLLFGLLSFPSHMLLSLSSSLVIAVILIFIARPLAMILILKPFKRSMKEICFISAAGLRGAASLVFAVMALNHITLAGTPIRFDLFHTVFWVVIFSISLQGSIVPLLAQKLRLVDDNESVMKTFTDYQEEGELNLVEIKIHPGSTWENKYLRELDLPGDALVVLIKRESQEIIPQGSTKLLAEDVLIINYPGFISKSSSLCLQELQLTGKHPWINRKIKELELAGSGLIVVIRRRGESLNPHADMRLRSGDTLLISGNCLEKDN